MKCYSYENEGGGRKSCSHAEGGVTQGFEVVLTQEIEVLAILMGCRKMFPSFKRGGHKKFYPVSRVGSKMFRTRDFLIL